jgi:FMN phosphatase YigB (HAD superfamily)
MLQTFSPQSPIICSYLVGNVKPHIQIYKEADKQAKNLGFGKIILVEDKAKYLMPGIENFSWYGIHLTINQDPEEAIKQVAGHTGEVKPSERLLVANSVQELEQALRDLNVKI